MSFNRRSRIITQGIARSPNRAMLRAVGFGDGDFDKPIIGVANTWIEIGPCNYHLRDLAAAVKRGMRTLRDDGWRKVVEGVTTTAEVLRVTQDE